VHEPCVPARWTMPIFPEEAAMTSDKKDMRPVD